MSEGRNPYDPNLRAPQSVAHLRFWVGLGTVAALTDRQRGTTQLCGTRVDVKFAYRLRPKDQIVDIDLAHDQAELLIRTLGARGAPLYTSTEIRFQALSHEITDSGEFAIMSLEFFAQHLIQR